MPVRAPLSLTEPQRLEVLRAYDILDSAPEEMFDEITTLAAEICETPIALVSLVDESRLWFKSKVGMTLQEMPRETVSFCCHLLSGQELLVVPDALADSRFAQHPLVQGEPQIRFYAGVPLLAPEGAVLGALCVIDCVPRQLSELQLRTLSVLGKQIMRQIQMQRDVLEMRHSQQAVQSTMAEREQTVAALRYSEAEQRQLAERLEAAQQAGGIGSWVVDVNTFEAEWSDETHRVFGTDPATTQVSFEAFLQRVHPEDYEAVDQAFKESIVGGTPSVFIHRMVMDDGRVRHIEQRWQAFRDDEGVPYQAIGTSQDVTARILAEFRLQRLNRLYAVSNGINAAIVRITDTQQLYEEACRIAVEQGGLIMAWVGIAYQDSQTLQPVAVHGNDAGYLAEAQVSLLPEPRGMGPSGRAYRENQVAFSRDMATDPLVAPWCVAALERGYRSCASFPLRAQGEPFGVFSVYGGVCGFFDEDAFEFLSAIAENLSYAVESHLREQQRQQTEIALRTSEARFRSYFELSMHGIAVTTPEKGWIQANDRLCTILGYPREELMTRNWADITYPDDLPADMRYFGRLLAGTIEKYEIEKRFIRKDGRIIWTSIGVGCVRNADGTIAYIIGVLLDIDARKQNEQMLGEQATLLDNAQDAILVRDLRDRITYWNKSAERLYGWTAEEAIGQSCEELLHLELTDFKTARETTLNTGKWMGELQQRSRDGRLITVEARWTLIRDEAGQPKSLLGINTDISARKQLEQQFLRTQRMESIGTLAGGIAHDLNNVLAPIMMSIDLLRLRETDPRRLEVLSTIEGSARRGADMVKQVLSFARGVVGEKVDVQLGHLIAEIAKIVNETFLQHIHVHADVPAGLWVVRGDPTQMHQVLLNLCVNARDAMPSGGTITITASNVVLDAQSATMHIDATHGPYVRISVQDTGTGMPPEVVDRIFEPFFTTKEVGHGTGLGLSTSVSIVKQHGGFVRVRSDLGKGTTFSIYLPAQMECSESSEEICQNTLPQGDGELILVVDDEAAVLDITRQTLESYGYRVLLAANGVDALALYTSHQADIAVVLTDLMMPVMDGPTAIQVLRHINPQVRIVAASGLNADALVAKATNAGASQFLSKPYTAETLLHALRTALSGGPE
jgi:PAS domain S-box-containing protein